MTAATPEARSRWRGGALLAVKLVVTGALVVWLLKRVDLGAVATNLRSSLGPWLVAALVVGAGNIMLGVVRWRLLLTALGSPLAFGLAARLLWSGLFFNTFLPAGVVGDALRGAWTARSADRARGFWSVILDRVAALAGVALVAAVGLLLPAARELPVAPTLALACFALGLPALLLLAGSDQVARFAVRVGGERVRRALEGKITDPPPWGPRFRALLLACVLQLFVVVIMALLARAAQVQVPLGVLLAVVPAVMVASYVPVSVSGIGVRDVALVELLGQAGVPTSAALTISVLYLCVTIVLSLIGGAVYLTSGSLRSDPAVSQPG